MKSIKRFTYFGPINNLHENTFTQCGGDQNHCAVITEAMHYTWADRHIYIISLRKVQAYQEIKHTLLRINSVQSFEMWSRNVFINHCKR